MLPAHPRPLAGALLTLYIRWCLRTHFDRIVLFGDRPELATDAAYPLVWYSTHQTWWDGFLEIPLCRRYGQRLWLMMEERNLRRFPAFRWVGVFGVDLTSARGRGAALLYASKRLRGPGRSSLYLYPHGKLVPAFADWPAFQGGVSELLRLCPQARAIPVAKEIVHGRQRDPVAFLELGEPLRGDSAQLEQALSRTRDRLRTRIADEDEAGAVELLGPKWWAAGRTEGT